ncbi:uncharacterized protein LOC131945959 [Physella acuta]|uniref:uncharacterized protein LOC131945959 n=1 Tax=Physella acuta TaxID=109671 RepID=UPI0027DD951B|nr:uncharacterized protein LOC131945959 [Physella acuta]
MSLQYALVFLLPCLAYAQIDLKPYNYTATALFLNYDDNRNGEVSRQEIDLAFRFYDTNNNGRISRLEYTNYIDNHNPALHPLSHALYDIYDVDSDDQLDHHDFDNFFALMDSDDNQIVSHYEFVRYWTILLEELEHLHAPN